MYKNLLILLLLVFPFFMNGQISIKKKEDKTKRRYDYIEKNKNEVDVTTKLLKAKKIQYKNPSKAIELVQEGLIASKLDKNIANEALCYSLLGEIYYSNNQYEVAKINFLKSSPIFKSLGLKEDYHNDLLSIAKASLKLKDYLDAENYVIQLLELNPKENILADVQEILGEIDYQQANYDKAIEHFKQQEMYEISLSEINKNSNYKLSKAQTNLAKVYSKQQDFDKADAKMIESFNSLSFDTIIEDRYLNDSQPIFLEEVNDLQKDEYLGSQEEVFYNYRNTDNTEKEIVFRSKSLLSNSLNTTLFDEAVQNQNIGEAYLQNNDLTNAVLKLSESVEYEWDEAEVENKANSLKLLSKALSQSGDNEEALIKYQEYVETQELVLKKKQQEQLQSIKLLSQQNKIEVIEKEFDLYQSDKNLEYSLEQKYRTQKMINYGLLVVLLFVVIASYFIYKSAKEKRKANQMLALKSLRSQMNPHFIFNALNSVNSFISKNDERSANKFLTQFSKLMRMVLESSHQDLIPISQELQVIELYLKLEQYRFRDKFDYELEISDGIDQENFMIPPMLIQPFIENAVWHGLRYKECFGTLKVYINNVGGEIEVVIKDNGIGRKKSFDLKTKNQQQTQSRGLQNTKERIKVINDLYQTNLELNVTDLAPDEVECGTKIRLLIPSI